MLKKIINFFYENWKIYTFLIFLTITFLSLYPLKEEPNIPGSDKIHHLIAYSALTVAGTALAYNSNELPNSHFKLEEIFEAP